MNNPFPNLFFLQIFEILSEISKYFIPVFESVSGRGFQDFGKRLEK